MILDPQQIPKREKLILAGLFLSKFDKIGLRLLGLETFTEAFNVIGFALGGKPASIKNYRDEFDPLFPNPRAGRHQRSTRAYCSKVLTEYQSLDLQTFSAFIKSFVGFDEKASSELPAEGDGTGSAFARRLITGLAAERYFESVQPGLSEFRNYVMENTTRLGCGYDFRLQSKTDAPFIAVEVKGLRDKAGGLSLTPKEHHLAKTLTDRFYLFVVKNFRESPFHEIYRNPLAGPLCFERKKRVVVQVSWLTSV
ncbi:hypothetical protein LBMAG57_00800 [Verrucomicrobiota bacterium]|nr:hypothetical protein LBMAG57_00800 [Verrucomicrobiota bacterium]